MESIDKLRKWANGLHGVYINRVDHTITVTTGWDSPPNMDSVSLRDHINGILDGIDKEVDDMWHALTIDAKPMTDENMAADGWIRLPKDADGVPIHVGDVMEVISSKQYAKACYMQMGPSGTWAVGLTQDCHWYDTESLRHHAPTVEDVLREFVERLDEIGSEDDCVGEAEQECRACIRRDIAAAYAEYAAKLRLVGDE